MLESGQSVADRRGTATTPTPRSAEVGSGDEATPSKHLSLFGAGDAPPYADGDVGAAYWEARYSCTAQDSFDWYMDPETVGPVLKQRLPSTKGHAELLETGCGTSELAAWLYCQGWRNITGVDASVAAITRARGARRHATRPELQFVNMDACHMSFPDSCFDAVYEKALFDTLVTGGQAIARAVQYLDEVHRVLRHGGVFIFVSHAGLAVRLPWLVFNPAWTWSIEVCKLPKPPPPCVGGEGDGIDGDTSHSNFFHVYVLTKH